MSHVLAGLGPVPVTRVCWNEHDHARRPEILTMLTPDGREAVHVARKDVGDASRRFPLVRFDHSHAWMVARVGQT